MKDKEEAGLEAESQGQTQLGPWSFCQMELAFPQGRIKQASPAVIQGDISQWGNQTTSRTHGKCGALGQGFQMTPCVVGSMVWLLFLGTQADGPSEQSKNLLVPHSPDLLLLSKFSL